MYKFMINEIAKELAEKRNVPEDIFFGILNNVSQMFVEKPEEVSVSLYDRTLFELDEIWQHQNLDDLTIQQAYLYGAIWGSLRMVDSIKMQKMERAECIRLANKYKDRASFLILCSIINAPGIQSNVLSAFVANTDQDTDKIISDMIQDRLIGIQEFGDEEMYYIRTRGEKVYELIEKMQSDGSNKLAHSGTKTVKLQEVNFGF